MIRKYTEELSEKYRVVFVLSDDLYQLRTGIGESAKLRRAYATLSVSLRPGGTPAAQIGGVPPGPRYSASVSRCVFARSTHSSPPRTRAIPSSGTPPSWRTGPRLSPLSGWS